MVFRSLDLRKILGDKRFLVVLAAAIAVRTLTSILKLEVVAIWPSGIPGPSLWGDYSVYLQQLHYLAQGYLPYRDFSYNFGPLFLLTLFPFYALSNNLAFIPIVLADAFTAPAVYLTLKQDSGKNVPMIAGLIYGVSPLFLVNEGYLWLSSQPFTLFLVCSVLLYTRKRALAGTLSLAVAICFKQEAVFLLPPFLIAYLWRYRKRALKYIGAGLAFVIGVSSPFLYYAPRAFIYSMMYGNFINLGPVEPSRLQTVGSSTVTPFQSVLCGVTTITHVYTGAFCGTLMNLGAFEQFLVFARFYDFLKVINPFLFCIFLVGLISIRKSEILYGVSCVFALLGGLLVFSILVHSSLGYYYIPIYALLLLLSKRPGQLALTTLGLEAVIFLPEGPLQFLIPLVLVFALVVSESVRLESINAPPRSASDFTNVAGPPLKSSLVSNRFTPK
jgi:hypothetical protein